MGRGRQRLMLGSCPTVPVFERLGSEFMPELNEGVLLYMPTTRPAYR